jgi:hypothetical protein
MAGINRYIHLKSFPFQIQIVTMQKAQLEAVLKLLEARSECTFTTQPVFNDIPLLAGSPTGLPPTMSKKAIVDAINASIGPQGAT